MIGSQTRQPIILSSKNRVGASCFPWHLHAMKDYDRIAAVIRYLDEHQGEQPDLAVMAKQAGLSVFHFHRLFRSWAAITPKDFVQCLTAAHARRALQEGENVLSAALGSGLSGPGRLHDLCVNLEAASPGELKSGGKGWTIFAGFAESPFGRILVAQGPRGLCHLSFVDPGADRAEWERLRASWPAASLRRQDAVAARVQRRIFKARVTARPGPPLNAFVRGTAFQVSVWRALIRIPPGNLSSYGRLAEAVGRPGAARAVGGAVAQNPLAYLIPCHRVIRETGVLGGYRWGTIRKRALIARETSPQTGSA